MLTSATTCRRVRSFNLTSCCGMPNGGDMGRSVRNQGATSTIKSEPWTTTNCGRCVPSANTVGNQRGIDCDSCSCCFRRPYLATPGGLLSVEDSPIVIGRNLYGSDVPQPAWFDSGNRLLRCHSEFGCRASRLAPDGRFLPGAPLPANN